jgi:signal transduction histidine kinase/DNA-binding response OmpR family regulator/streptogramin lyase
MTALRTGLLLVLINLVPGQSRSQQVMPQLVQQVSKPAPLNQITDSMVEDAQGRLWMATDNGVVCYDGQQFRVYHDPLLGKGDSYFHVMASPDGRIWCKPNASNFLSYIDPKQPRIVRIADSSPLVSQYLPVVGYNYVFAGRDATLWIGQQGGLLKVNPRTFAVEPILRNDKLEVTWITQDPQGVIWFSTNQGVYAYEASSKRLIHYQRNAQQPTTSLGQDRAYSVQARPNGTILVGLNNEINVITPATQSVRRISLPATTRFGVVPVHEMYLDSVGNAYFRTQLGAAYRYTIGGELQRLELRFPSQAAQLVFPGRGNRLWVDTERTLDAYDLSRIGTVPNLHLIEVVVSGTPLAGPTPDARFVRDTLGHPSLTIQDTDSLRLRVSPYAGSQSAEFRYRLVGHDANWYIVQGPDATVTYQQLRAGTYTFELNAQTPSGGWATSIGRLTVIVRVPFWKTGWFWALVLTIAGIIGTGLLQSGNRRQQLRRELARRAMEAKTLRQLDEVKNQFFANITHEFRTPLTIILNATQQLDDGSLATDKQARLGTIQRSAHQLLRLISQTLELARLEAGKLERRQELGDPISFLHQLIRQFEGLAKENHQTLSWTPIGPPVGATPLYSFDPDKLEKIVYNLLANALKFTPTGGQVKVEGGIRDAHQLVLRITDTGIGIPADQLPRIFDRFHQVDSSTTRAYQGTGIGLTLVKELAEWLGGTVTVTSAVGQGSCFTVALPLVPAGAESMGGSTKPSIHPPSADSLGLPARDSVSGVNQEAASGPLAGGALPVVLVVEDNEDLRRYVADYLSGFYQVLMAFDGRQGLDMALTEVPDLIVSDVMMPELDGLELVSRLKRDERTSHIPVVLLTAKATYGSRLQGLRAGADDYLIKPFSLEELSLRIGNCLQTRRNWQHWLTSEYAAGMESVVEPDPRLTKEKDFLARLRQLVLANLHHSPTDVDWLAGQVNMSRTQLYRKLTSLTGQSPIRFMQQLRLERAAELLQQGTLNVAQVAYEVGYSSPSHFTKVFQEQFGYLPKQLKA